MAVIRELIEYEGVSQSLSVDIQSFRQMNIQNIAYLPKDKIDIQDIIKIQATPHVKESYVINTLKGTSLEGLHLTGKKLIIEGEVSYKMEYIADNRAQSIYTFYYKSPFISSIILPEQFTEKVDFIEQIFIEDLYGYKMSERCIYLNTTLLLTAKIG